MADARYDAIVVWCDDRDDTTVAVDLAITAGDHKGDAVTVVAARRALRGRTPLDVVGLPCTLVVRDGAPSIEW
jgi:hypothetical protein